MRASTGDTDTEETIVREVVVNTLNAIDVVSVSNSSMSSVSERLFTVADESVHNMESSSVFVFPWR